MLTVGRVTHNSRINIFEKRQKQSIKNSFSDLTKRHHCLLTVVKLQHSYHLTTVMGNIADEDQTQNKTLFTLNLLVLNNAHGLLIQLAY